MEHRKHFFRNMTNWTEIQNKYLIIIFYTILGQLDIQWDKYQNSMLIMKNRGRLYLKYFHQKCIRQCNPKTKNISKTTTTSVNKNNKVVIILKKILSKILKDKNDSIQKIEGSMTLNELIKKLKNN